MTRPKILVQLDGDAHPSVFDSVVAVDAGVDQLLRHGAVEPTEVRDLVHGAMFTRGPQDLHNTAIFIGGSDVSVGENLLNQVKQCFFGPMRVSVMLDANGANTTAAAAVLAARGHLELKDCQAVVLAGTGPVGQRATRLLAAEGAHVRVGSRSVDRAQAVCDAVSELVRGAQLSPHATVSREELSAALEGATLVISAGAAGVELLPKSVREQFDPLQVAIDLNAVAPAGIEGIAVTDKAAEQNGTICYGAVGVGGMKMKIHKAALRRLFESNDVILDADEIYELGRNLEATGA